MTTTSDPAQDFQNVEKALDLLRAFRTNPYVRAQNNPAFGQALRKYATANTPEEMGAELGRLAQGQVILANILVEAIAKMSDTSADDVVQKYEDQTQHLITQLKPE